MAKSKANSKEQTKSKAAGKTKAKAATKSEGKAVKKTAGKSDAKASKTKPMTKSIVLQHLAETTKLTKKQVTEVFEALTSLIKEQLGPRGPGSFTIPGLLKLKTVIKPPTPEREGIHPFTKEPTVFKAKPERKSIKARPLKTLNDQIG
jgi:nucleoid DNA-binding protein